MLKENMSLTETKAVFCEDTALNYKSGSLKVFATPAMIALMEYTSMTLVQGEIEDGLTTVGTKVNIEHISATPVGMTVKCTSVLSVIDGRRLVFEVVCEDEKGIIGKGTHERFIVRSESFQKKTDDKLCAE